MTCPICREPTQKDFRPFCSRRCADIDLGRWMLGSYAIPADDDDDRPEAPAHPGDGDTPTEH